MLFLLHKVSVKRSTLGFFPSPSRPISFSLLRLCRECPRLTIVRPSSKTAFNSVQFSRSVVSDSLRSHELQHTRPPCSSPTPGAYANSCPLSQWCHPIISSSVVPFSSCPQSFPKSGSFLNESALLIRWPKYWSFSFNISPSSEHPGLISFRVDWLDLLAVQGTLKSLLQHHSSKASMLQHSAFFIVQLSHPYMTRISWNGISPAISINKDVTAICHFSPLISGCDSFFSVNRVQAKLRTTKKSLGGKNFYFLRTTEEHPLANETGKSLICIKLTSDKLCLHLNRTLLTKGGTEQFSGSGSVEVLAAQSCLTLCNSMD